MLLSSIVGSPGHEVVVAPAVASTGFGGSCLAGWGPKAEPATAPSVVEPADGAGAGGGGGQSVGPLDRRQRNAHDGDVGLGLHFSRGQESEADHIGLVYMARAGYDPHQAVAFWKRMLRASKGKEPPEFASDHPSDAHRIAQIEKWLPEAEQAPAASREGSPS